MQITEDKGADGKPVYEVSFVERRLEEIVARLNRFKRADEKPFEAVSAVSEFNQRAYELFARPLVQALSNEYSAKLGREFHPLRFQRWAISDLNPWLWWLGPAAQAVKAQRQAVEPDDPARKAEKMMSELTSASLDYYRALRDAVSEAAFFQIYGNLFSLYLADQREAEEPKRAADPRELPFVKEALASIDEGGYAEAVARVAFLLARKGEPLPLSRLQLKQELIADYRELLPAVSPRRGAPDSRRAGDHRALRAREGDRQRCRRCSRERADRERLVTLLDRLLADERIQQRRAVERAEGDARAHPRRASRSGGGRAASRRRGEAIGEHSTWIASTRSTSACSPARKRCHRVPTAVAHPCDESSLTGAVDAAKMGLIAPILVGPAARIKAVAEKCGLDISAFEIVDTPHSHASAAEAVRLVREGRAECLMKGSLHTDELMGAVVAREGGLRTARRISHCFVMDVPTYSEVLIVSDAAVNIAPTLEDKVDIVQNAIDLAHALGAQEVRVAILSAMETVNPEGPLDDRGGRAVQDGRPRADHRRHPGRAAGARQRDQPAGRGDQAHQVAGGGPRQRADRARSRGRQHAGQEPDVPGRRRRRRDRARRARADHPHQPRRLGDDPARFLRRGRARREGAARGAVGTGRLRSSSA